MRADGFRDCIVTVIDLIDIRAIAAQGQASSVMVTIHNHVIASVNAGNLPSHTYIYLWNDSILLLAYIEGDVNRRTTKTTVLREANILQRDIDKHWKRGSYGISVQGMAFP